MRRRDNRLLSQILFVFKKSSGRCCAASANNAAHNRVCICQSRHGNDGKFHRGRHPHAYAAARVAIGLCERCRHAAAAQWLACAAFAKPSCVFCGKRARAGTRDSHGRAGASPESARAKARRRGGAQGTIRARHGRRRIACSSPAVGGAASRIRVVGHRFRVPSWSAAAERASGSRCFLRRVLDTTKPTTTGQPCNQLANRLCANTQPD